MKYEFRLQLYKSVAAPFEIDFICSKRQADKLFFALAFACTNCSVVAARLYRCTRDKLSGCPRYTLVNQFDAKSAAQRLVNWVADHILLVED